jgi:hypothetical protein
MEEALKAGHAVELRSEMQLEAMTGSRRLNGGRELKYGDWTLY